MSGTIAMHLVKAYVWLMFALAAKANVSVMANVRAGGKGIRPVDAADSDKAWQRRGAEGGEAARTREPQGACSRVGGPLGLDVFHSGNQDGCELEEELGDSRVSLHSESRKEEPGLHGAASRGATSSSGDETNDGMANEDDRVSGDPVVKVRRATFASQIGAPFEL
jgi:hypothetical protein